MEIDYITPPEFAGVVIDSLMKQACSPTPPRPSLKWRGVDLRAPYRVQATAQRVTIFPVCGYFFLPADALEDELFGLLKYQIDGLPPQEPVWIGLDNEGNEVEPSPSLLSPEEKRDVSIGGYFSFDLACYIPVPDFATFIRFTLSIGGKESQTIVIEWQPLPKQHSGLD